MAFDASPSWSGFNYQGKVALYYTLLQINALPVQTDLSKLSLVLEDNEDFEVRDNGTFVSFHQVKAYNTSSYSKYSDALLEITLELSKKPNVLGKIHTWKQINPKASFTCIIDSLRNDIQSIIDEYRGANPKIGNTIIEKAISDAPNRPKPAAIIKSAFPSDSATDICSMLTDIVLNQNDAISRLEAYVYDDGNSFCDLNSINEKIKSEISNLLSSRNLINTQQRVEQTLHYFLGMMDKHIIDRHKAKQGTDKVSISFVEIIEAAIQDHEDIGLHYLSCVFKEKFAHLLDEYINDPDSYEEVDDKCNLKEAKNILLNLEPLELWNYYRHFCPHINLQELNNTENALKVDENGIRFVLIKILHELDYNCISNVKEKCQITYETTSLPIKRFIPSTIMNGIPLTHVEKKIILNSNMWEFLFEVENIIYDGSDIHLFSPKSITHTEAPIGDDEDPRSKRDDMLSNISLVPISNAKVALSS
ncbi:TPA: ABC-three component system protein [Vibrio alginolyticus]|uniref:ABC-three component system protein n=1 Tax=Vibrio alginolyticus TaxID=663 RepID=UPI00063DAB33|nr:ABC-three component system protein [Vibrio alginolyticus]KLI70280.1 hypothetical protein AAW26_21565 [Vibrio alginolyticus]MDM4740594.1 hypothetical protein [Vibrio alginolyticus]MDM4760946.1 hypothetical protein [Vibrio alginolyticus]